MKKKSAVTAIIISLLFGIAIGFSIPLIDGQLGDNFAINKSVSKKVKGEFTKEKFLHSIRIDSAEADEMIRKYRKQNDRAIFRRLRTDQNSSLHGFWIPKLIMDTIMNQEGANGLRIYLAKRKEINSRKRIFTLVLLGTRGKKDDFLGKEENSDMTSKNDFIFDHVDPCPQLCGRLGGD